MSLYSKVHPDWMPVILTLINSDPKLKSYLEDVEKGIYAVTPYASRIFEAFSFSPKKIKVVILGREPFVHQKHATGKAFAIQNTSPGISIDLAKLFFEMGRESSDTKRDMELEYLEKQGVFLLNVNLTRINQLEYLDLWLNFTRGILRYLRANVYPVIIDFEVTNLNHYIPNLKLADTYSELNQVTTETRSLDYKSPIVSGVKPQSSLFIGSNVFKITNQLLKLKKQTEIEW